MKKLIALILCLLLPFAVLAEMDEDGDIMVTLPGAQFFFTPVEGYCLTRETSASLFNLLGMSQRDTFAYMEEYGVCAILYDADFTVEIQVMAWESVDTDFDEMTDFGAAAMAASIRRDYEDQGWQVHSCETYRAPEGHVFIRSECSATLEDGMTECVTEYLTCQAGYSVSVAVYSLTEAFDARQQLLGEALADSLWISAVQ